MIVKKRGNLVAEPMSVAIHQIARTGLDRLIDYTKNDSIYYLIEEKGDSFKYGSATIGVHIYYNVMSNKIYMEYYISNDLKDLLRSLPEDYSGDFARYISGTLRNGSYFENSIHTYAEVIFPKNEYDKYVDTTNVITPYTVNYWKNWYNKYEVLEDKPFVEHWWDEILVRYPNYDKNIIYRQIYDINIRYQLGQGKSSNIPQAFEEYRNLFINYFGRDLNKGVYERNTLEFDEATQTYVETPHRAVRNPEIKVYISYIIP